jgi:hypothetical protein
MGGSFNVSANSTYFIYIADTTYGSSALQKPLSVSLTEIDCTSFGASAVTLSPANGATTTSLVPKLSVDFDTDLKTGTGTVTLVGNKGTNITYTLSAFPSQISWANSNKTLNISPGVAFPAGEVVQVNLSGFLDNKCGKAIKAPTWSFTVVTPPCAPGTNGMVGATVTKQATGLTLSSEYYMATDQSATGYVYIGGYSELWRAQKTSPTSLQNVGGLAGLTSSYLGYGMLIDGNSMFALNDAIGTTTRLYRFSSDGGSSWINPAQDFATFSPTPGDYTYAGAAYKGKIYLLTRETSTTTNTQVWSLSDSPASIPTAAVLETSVAAGETYCTGIAVDDVNYYLTCGTNDHLVRVARATGAVTVISTNWDLDSYYSNPIYAHDTNGDGTADYLYFKGGTREVFFVCNPASATPYSDKMASWGTTSTSNYGLAFDSANKTLYSFDDSTHELIVIK